MIYAPHILQVKRPSPILKDEYGRPLPGSGEDTWQTVCPCRCDDNTTKEFKSDNGVVFRPAYHIVCEGQHGLAVGEYARCLCGNDVRGEGTIYNAPRPNYFNYSEIWI